MKYKKLKRIISGLLAGAMLMTYPSGMLLSYAAEKGSIDFVTGDATQSKNTTVIEGSYISANVVMPDEHNFIVEKPFVVQGTKGGGTVVQGDKFFDITPDGPYKYGFKAKPGSALLDDKNPNPKDPTGKASYTLAAQLNAVMKNGSGLAKIKQTDGTFVNVMFESVICTSAIAIMEESSMSFKMLADAPTDDKPLQVSNVLTAQGRFATDNFLDGAVAMKKSKSGNQFEVIVSPKGVGEVRVFTISIGTNVELTKDSEITIKYGLQPLNDLLLTVVTPQYAVNELRDNIFTKPTDKENNYIELTTGDSLQSITSKFTLASKAKKFNSDISIHWDWIPDAGTPQDTIKITNNDSTGARSPVAVNMSETDLKGKLKATITYIYQPTSTDPAMPITAECGIPIVILGAGKKPLLEPKFKWSGKSGKEPITAFPSVMDVHNGAAIENPHTFTANLSLGTGRAHIDEVIIRDTKGSTDVVKIYANNNKQTAYKLGDKIPNDDAKGGDLPLEFVATKAGQVNFVFELYYKNGSTMTLSAQKVATLPITVVDSTPISVARLSSLVLYSPQLVDKYPQGTVPFAFDPETLQYTEETNRSISFPYSARELEITPTIKAGNHTDTNIEYRIDNTATGIATGKVASGTPIKIIIPEGATCHATLTLTAENGTTHVYFLTIIHQQPSTISSLESITVTDADGKEVLKQTAPTLKPGAYAVTVPYATRWVKFAVERSDPWSTVSFTPKLQTKGKGILGLLGIGDDWQKLTHPDDPTAQGDATTNQTITVTAQNTALQWASTYNINITRDAPSKNTMAQSLTIKDQLERKITFDKPTEKFEKTIKKYAVHIPYSSEELTLSILPDELVAQSVTVISPDGTTATKDYKDKNAPLDFTVKTPPTDLTTTKFAITFKVKSEGNTETDPLYTINVVRNPPSIDDAISEMLVTDQADETVKTFSYNPQQLDYTFAVPFNTEWLKITPKARSPLATITVKAGNKAAETISELNPNVVTPTLKSNVPMIIVVTIKPEDKAAAGRVYTLNVTREAPNTDARLKELVVTGGEKLKPDFVPNTTAYKVKLPTGTKSLTFTPVPIAPGATVTVNGNNAEVGKPSLPYEPIEVISTVTIVVTAQDGKTKMTYTVEVNNLNLVPKSSDADLASLVIREGSMSPPFKAGVTEYNVAVKDEVSFVDILPSTRNEEATLVVKADSKVLGDYYDRYSTAIRDGDNEITVEVTAEDGKTKKLYTVNVYRKDEEQQGAYKPITVDMINFSENPIVVDISKYTTVSAEVFNTLKEKYPDKTMVFEGNDYSLQLTGKSIEMLVPHATIYDLGITFTTPEDEAIWKIIDGEPKNNGIEPVFIHFNHHGALPGKMLFTLSLGRTYRTQNSTWNYYNDERDRIDYYGGIRTNSRGTFTVPISHMSTYIYCSKRIVGAENKSGNLGDIGDITGNSGVAGATGSVGKPNPNTGVGGQGE